MLKFVLARLALSSLVSVSLNAEARPGGCRKYGAAGASPATMPANHGVKGAVAGCALSMRKRREYKREMRMQHQSAALYRRSARSRLRRSS